MRRGVAPRAQKVVLFGTPFKCYMDVARRPCAARGDYREVVGGWVVILGTTQKWGITTLQRTYKKQTTKDYGSFWKR